MSEILKDLCAESLSFAASENFEYWNASPLEKKIVIRNKHGLFDPVVSAFAAVCMDVALTKCSHCPLAVVLRIDIIL